MMMKRMALIGLVVGVFLAGTALSAERHPMHSLVPAEQLANAQALHNPLPASDETVAKGRELYGANCMLCHGADGSGNGPVAASLDPSPRNFLHHGFWRHRSEGEIYWVIKHGSTGTAMVGFGPQLTDEEIWSVIRYLEALSGQHAGADGHGGMRGGPMHRGPHGPGEGGCCGGAGMAPSP
jgi:mono/diheme cytochrome c family protein